jgi:hypothetical protein
MLSTGIFLKIKFSKFLQTHFTSPKPIRMKKKLPYRVQFVRDYKKMPFRSTNFITLHGLLLTHALLEYALGIWICRCSLFYRREMWASKSAGANSTLSLKIWWYQ